MQQPGIDYRRLSHRRMSAVRTHETCDMGLGVTDMHEFAARPDSWCHWFWDNVCRLQVIAIRSHLMRD